MENAISGLQETVMTYGPKVIMSLVILVISIIVAKIISWIVKLMIGKIGIGDPDSRDELKNGVGSAVFWVIMLISLPMILEPLGMKGILEPLQNMVNEFLGFLPNLIGAVLIFGIGYIVATVAKKAIVSVLNATSIDDWSAKVGVGQGTIANALGTLAFVIIIVPIAISALDALDMQAISDPAKAMLQSILDAVPNVIAAAVIIGLAYVIAKFASNALNAVLPSLGVDDIGEKIGLSGDMGGTSISKIASGLVFAAIMIFGLIEGAKALNFQILSEMLAEILALGGHILMGSAIIAAGVVIANKIAELLSSSKSAAGAAGFVKFAIIILAAAMGLRQMGIANEIVDSAFTLVLGACAVGAAIAFGWGGKDVAGRLLDKWTKNM